MDEYFEARPNLFARQPESYNEASSQPGAVAASAVHRTMAANPQATADLISTGLKNIPKGSQYSAASNPVVANAAGRFAASSLASSYNTSSAKSPPAPPRRNVSAGEDTPSAPSVGRPTPSGASGGLGSLMSSKRFGDVDTSSVKAAFASSFKGGKPAAPPPSTTLPPAIGAPKRSFAPPPTRRVPTHASSENESPATPPEHRNNALQSQDLAPLRRMPSDTALRRDPSPPPDSSRHGERAEALYDYSSEAAEDINVREGDKLTIVERTSDDWWTGEINGRRGLLPASYVRIL